MDRELFEHYLSDESRRGAAADGAFTGAAGGAACGDLSRISLTVEDGRIAAVSFDAEGCGATQAATAAVAEMVDGAPVLEAAAIDDRRRRRRDRRPDAGQAPRRSARHRRAAPGARARPPRRLPSRSPTRLPRAAPHRRRDPDRRRPPSASPSPCPAASTAPSRRCSSASAGRRWSAVTVKLWADPETDGAKACCSPEAVLGARGARALARHPALHARPRGGIPPPRRRPLHRRLRRRQHPQPLRALQRRGADRGDGRPRRAARRRPPASPATTPASSRTPTGRCWPPPPTRPRTRATCWRRCRRSCSAGSRFPLTELTKPEVREIAARHGLAVAQEAREPGPLLPRRPGQAQASCAATAASTTARAPSLDRSGRAVGRHRGHHNFTVGQRRGIGVSAPEPLYVARHRRRRQHGHGRHPRRARNPPRPRPRRHPAPRRRPRRRGPPALPLARPAGLDRRRRPRPPRGPRGRARRGVRRRLAGPDGGAAGGRDDRRPRHDRRRGLTASTRPPAGPARSSAKYLGSLT